jgi:hypothetical protein
MIGLWGLIASSKLIAARHHSSSMCLAATQLHRPVEVASASCFAILMMLSKADSEHHRDADRERSKQMPTAAVQRCISAGAKAWVGAPLP